MINLCSLNSPKLLFFLSFRFGDVKQGVLTDQLKNANWDMQQNIRKRICKVMYKAYRIHEPFCYFIICYIQKKKILLNARGFDIYIIINQYWLQVFIYIRKFQWEPLFWVLSAIFDFLIFINNGRAKHFIKTNMKW